jgi:hypothetical protein
MRCCYTAAGAQHFNKTFAAASQECVRAGAAMGDAQLVSAALGDELVDELLEHLGGGGGGGELPRAARRVAERARVLAAVRASSWSRLSACNVASGWPHGGVGRCIASLCGLLDRWCKGPQGVHSRA